MTIRKKKERRLRRSLPVFAALGMAGCFVAMRKGKLGGLHKICAHCGERRCCCGARTSTREEEAAAV